MFRIFLFFMTIISVGVMIGVHLLMGGTMGEVELYVVGKIDSVINFIKGILHV